MRYNAHILSQTRSKIEEVVPMDTPFTLLLETSRLCNFKCRFCPQSNTGSFSLFKDNLMSVDMVKRITDQLKEFPKPLKKIYMHGTGEALLNPCLPEMIRIIKDSGVTGSIDLTSNGALLTHELSEKLVESGLNHLHISVEALDEEGYRRIAGISRFDYASFVENIKYFYKHKRDCRLTVKIAERSIGSEEDRQCFLNTYKEICDELFVENIYPIWPEFDLPKEMYSENRNGQYGQEVKEKAVCPQIFTVLAVKCDGRVSPCSVDWNNGNALGSIYDSTLYDMWNGEALKDLRVKHLTEGRQCVRTCSACGLPKYSCIDNLDPCKEKILERIKNDDVQ